MKNIEKAYLEEYGDIPKTTIERVEYLLSTLSFSHLKTPIFEEIKRINQIAWKDLHFVIYLVPKGTPRPRLGKGGVFYVSGAKVHKKLFAKFMEKQNIPLIKTPIKFICRTYSPIPSSMNNMEKLIAELGFIRPISKPDWDNLAKTYCDMLQDYLIQDDYLIVEGRLEKFYSIKPRIEIDLSYALSHDSKYNEKKMK